MIDGYAALGDELADALDDRLDAWMSYVGTAGCFLGVTPRPARADPGRRSGSSWSPPSRRCTPAAPAGTHRIEGGGVGLHRAPDGRGDWDAVEACRRPTRSRWPAGPRARRGSGPVRRPGANLVAALPVARGSARVARVATVLVDSGLKYLGGELSAERHADAGADARAAAGPRRDRRPATAGGPARRDVHRVQRDLLPLGGGLAVDRDGVPRRCSGCRCSSWSRGWSTDATAACRSGPSGWRCSPGSSSPATCCSGITRSSTSGPGWRRSSAISR